MLDFLQLPLISKITSPDTPFFFMMPLTALAAFRLMMLMPRLSPLLAAMLD